MNSTFLPSTSKFFKHLSKFENLAVFKRGCKSTDQFKKAALSAKVKRNVRYKDTLQLMIKSKLLRLIAPGSKVLDIGAAPNSWSEFLVQKTNSTGKEERKPVGLVIGIDERDFEKIDGVKSLPKMDFMKQSSQSKILQILGKGNKFDFIHSNLSSPEPDLNSLDKARMTKSVLCVFLFMAKHLKKGGSCMIKVHVDDKNIKSEAKKLFREISFPQVVISPSSQPVLYLVGMDFLGV